MNTAELGVNHIIFTGEIFQRQSLAGLSLSLSLLYALLCHGGRGLDVVIAETR